MPAFTCFRLKVTLLIVCFQCWIRSRQYAMLRNIVPPSAARCPCAAPSPTATLPATSIGLRTETGRNFDRLRRPNGLLSTTKVTDINSMRRDRPRIYIRQGGYVISLFVCLSSSKFCAKTPERICVTFSRKAGNGPLNKLLNFGGDLGHRLDTGIVFRIRHYWKIRKVLTDKNLLLILIRQMAALERRALAEVCTVPVILVTIVLAMLLTYVAF